jgi:hypothetical protein
VCVWREVTFRIPQSPSRAQNFSSNLERDFQPTQCKARGYHQTLPCKRPRHACSILLFQVRLIGVDFGSAQKVALTSFFLEIMLWVLTI